MPNLPISASALLDTTSPIGAPLAITKYAHGLPVLGAAAGSSGSGFQVVYEKLFKGQTAQLDGVAVANAPAGLYKFGAYCWMSQSGTSGYIVVYGMSNNGDFVDKVQVGETMGVGSPNYDVSIARLAALYHAGGDLNFSASFYDVVGPVIYNLAFVVEFMALTS